MDLTQTNIKIKKRKTTVYFFYDIFQPTCFARPVLTNHQLTFFLIYENFKI